MLLKEIFDTNIQWVWQDSPNHAIARGKYKGKLKTKVIELHLRKLHPKKNSWLAEFTVDGEVKLTGDGDSIPIFSLVLRAISDWTIDYNPEWLIFGADKKEPTRVELYKKLPKFLAPTWVDMSNQPKTWPPEVREEIEWSDGLAFTVLTRKSANVSQRNI